MLTQLFVVAELNTDAGAQEAKLHIGPENPFPFPLLPTAALRPFLPLPDEFFWWNENAN